MGRLTTRELASATPATRNRYVDLLRFVSIALVVLGHWLLAVLGYEDGAFVGENLLELEPDLQIATWLFQVMPIFFLVGGYTNALSWDSATRRGEPYGDWLRARSTRLLRPALVFLAFWTVLPMLAVAIALPSSMALVGGREVSLPLWFLSVYVLVVAAAPALVRAHRRFGVTVVVVLAAATVLTDIAHYGLDLEWIAVANYLFVWLAILELGFLWRDGALRGVAWTPWAMLAGGAATVIALVTWLDYPVSMITLSHADRSNAFPPSLALLALGVAQTGLVLLLEDGANRWLQRPRVWFATATANSMIMTFYLWNMSAVVLAAVLVFPTGIAPQPEPLSAAWWALRPVWIALCAVCLLPFLFGFRWAERPVPLTPGRVPGVLSLVGTVLAAAGLAVIAREAFPVQGEQLLWPGIGVACVVVGAVLLRVDPIAPLRRPASDPGIG
ncbi:MAG TPA: acyltransferase [Actinomycetota bacterium]|nr:acyltransferase [Actinomycetota bacterium]